MIILASDGLWEFLSTAEVVDIADEYEQPVVGTMCM
jgi:serine/threonine protein phosphatase PrpC